MKFSLSRVLLSLLVLKIPAFAISPGFPIKGLEDRVDFWIKIFVEYGEKDRVIHDSYHVNLIYDVAVGDADPQPLVRNVERALDEILANINSPENLGGNALRIQQLVADKDLPLTAATVRQLRNGIHVQRGIKERFRQGIIRSGRYLDYFQEVFEREGVPPLIALLPLVESSFENRAFSRAGAAGVWQFMRGTAQQFMRVSGSVDERLDPVKSTQGAARLLRSNYRRLGTWPLAINAYNHGANGMARARAEHGDDIVRIINDYRGPSYGYASRNFYPEFLAAVIVYEAYPQYFGQLVLDQPGSFGAAPVQVAARLATTPVSAAAAGDGTTHTVRRGETLSTIARRHGVAVRTLMTLNALRNDRIYPGQVLTVNEAPPLRTAAAYQVRSGDTLWDIARRFGVEVQQLMEHNGLRSARIYAGQMLMLGVD